MTTDPHIRTNERNRHFWGARFKNFANILLHQFICTVGVLVFANFSLTYSVGMLNDLGVHVRLYYVHWLLTDNPFYPVQIALSLYVGYWLGRYWKYRGMMWMWVVPLMFLTNAIITGYSLIPEWNSVLYQSAGITVHLSHYFGWSCLPSSHCLDQLLITLPFYTSLAYSFGGWLGLHGVPGRKFSPTCVCESDEC